MGTNVIVEMSLGNIDLGQMQSAGRLDVLDIAANTVVVKTEMLYMAPAFMKQRNYNRL